jgi:hypothetical protein
MASAVLHLPQEGTMRILTFTILAVIALLFTSAASPGPNELEFALYPPTTELTLFPGEHGTVMFYVESAAWMTPPRMDLVASLVDWRIEKNGTVRYVNPGTWEDSAAAWTSYSPGAISLVAGGMERMRVTIRVPMRAEPGIYRTGVLVEPMQASSKNVSPYAAKFTKVFRITVRVLPGSITD